MKPLFNFVVVIILAQKQRARPAQVQLLIYSKQTTQNNTSVNQTIDDDAEQPPPLNNPLCNFPHFSKGSTFYIVKSRTLMELFIFFFFTAMTSSMAAMVYSCQAGSNFLHPLVIVPGSGGNQLEARLTKEYKPSSPLCGRWYPARKDKHGWFRLWFDPTVLLAPFTRCFADRMTLCYDPDIDDYRNEIGVETRVPNFGSTRGLLYLDPNRKHITAYMATLVESLEQIGYVDGETLYGAPYDFRYGLAADGHLSRVGTNFLHDLKGLVEKASKSNGGKPVILLSHSLGGLFCHQLLVRNTPSWRKKYIKHFVALSSPWGGTVQEMLTFASGYSLGVPLVNPLLVRAEQRSSESNLWLMPNPKVFSSERPLVITPNTTYSSRNITKFLKDIGFQEGIQPYKTRILPLVEDLVAPQVPVTCIIGTNVSTAETLLYGASGFDEQPDVIYGDGDGTVNIESLLAVESLWTNNGNHSLKIIKIPGVSHTSVLQDDVALDELFSEISCINLNSTSSSL